MRAMVPPGKRMRNPDAQRWLERPAEQQRKRGPGSGGAAADFDPMDPSSYSDAPVGGWGSGLARAQGRKQPDET